MLKQVEIKPNMLYNNKYNIAVASDNEMQCAENSDNITGHFISVKEESDIRE